MAKKRTKPRQHWRRLKSGKKVLVNKGVKKKAKSRKRRQVTEEMANQFFTRWQKSGASGKRRVVDELNYSVGGRVFALSDLSESVVFNEPGKRKRRMGKGFKVRGSLDDIRRDLLLDEVQGATSALSQDPTFKPIIKDITDKIKKDELRSKEEVFGYLDKKEKEFVPKKRKRRMGQVVIDTDFDEEPGTDHKKKITQKEKIERFKEKRKRIKKLLRDKEGSHFVVFQRKVKPETRFVDKITRIERGLEQPDQAIPIRSEFAKKRLAEIDREVQSREKGSRVISSREFHDLTKKWIKKQEKEKRQKEKVDRLSKRSAKKIFEIGERRDFVVEQRNRERAAKLMDDLKAGKKVDLSAAVFSPEKSAKDVMKKAKEKRG